MGRKLGNSSGIIKVDLENIILIDNVRKTYEEVEERARSIETKGQIQPVIVQPSPDNPDKYILIAGYTRYKAFEFLVSEGKPFNQIACIKIAGDILGLQLAENLQRSNLKSIEIEGALVEMIKRGDKQSDIVLSTNKSKPWVSDVLAASKIRAMIDSKHDTRKITSSALKHLRKETEETINKLVPEIIANGGTVAAVKMALAGTKPAEIPAITENIEPETEKSGKDKNVAKTPESAENEPSDKDKQFSGISANINILLTSGVSKADILEFVKKYLEV